MGTGFPYYTSRSYWIVSGLPSPWHILFNFSCHLFDSRLKKIGWLNYIEKRAVSFSLWQLSRSQLLGREPRNSRKHELAAGKRYVVLCTYQIPYHFLCCIWKKNWPLLLLQSHPHRHPFVLIPLLCPIVFCTDLHFVGWKFEMVFLLSVVESSKIHHSVLTIPPFISLSLIQFKLIEKCLTDAKSSSK